MKDLYAMYMIDSSVPEGQEQVREICKERLLSIGYDITEHEGNIYATHKDSTSLCVLSAHMDQVKTNGPAAQIYKFGTHLFGMSEDCTQTSLGADDKNGIFTCFKCAEHKARPPIVLFRDEECGCLGSNKIDSDFFRQYRCALVIDRRGTLEVLNGGSSGDYCVKGQLDKYFMDASPDIELKTGTGTISDTKNICKIIPALNLSASYHNAHSAKEITDVAGLVTMIDCIKRFLDNQDNWKDLPLDLPKPKIYYFPASKCKARYYQDGFDFEDYAYTGYKKKKETLKEVQQEILSVLTSNFTMSYASYNETSKRWEYTNSYTKAGAYEYNNIRVSRNGAFRLESIDKSKLTGKPVKAKALGKLVRQYTKQITALKEMLSADIGDEDFTFREKDYYADILRAYDFFDYYLRALNSAGKEPSLDNMDILVSQIEQKAVWQNSETTFLKTLKDLLLGKSIKAETEQ